MTQWWVGIPPVSAQIHCDTEVHRMTWQAGSLTLEHHDIDAETTLASLGSEYDVPRCVQIWRTWHVIDALPQLQLSLGYYMDVVPDTPDFHRALSATTELYEGLLRPSIVDRLPDEVRLLLFELSHLESAILYMPPELRAIMALGLARDPGRWEPAVGHLGESMIGPSLYSPRLRRRGPLLAKWRTTVGDWPRVDLLQDSLGLPVSESTFSYGPFIRHFLHGHSTRSSARTRSAFHDSDICLPPMRQAVGHRVAAALLRSFSRSHTTTLLPQGSSDATSSYRLAPPDSLDGPVVEALNLAIRCYSAQSRPLNLAKRVQQAAVPIGSAGRARYSGKTIHGAVSISSRWPSMVYARGICKDLLVLDILDESKDGRSLVVAACRWEKGKVPTLRTQPAQMSLPAVGPWRARWLE